MPPTKDHSPALDRLRPTGQIRQVHDLLAQFLDGDLPLELPTDTDLTHFAAMTHTLCWVLQHPHEIITALLVEWEAELAAKGYHREDALTGDTVPSAALTLDQLAAKHEAVVRFARTCNVGELSRLLEEWGRQAVAYETQALDMREGLALVQWELDRRFRKRTPRRAPMPKTATGG